MNDPATTISPKVIAGIVVSGGLTVILAVITAVTPEMLTSLGSWGVLVYAGIASLGGFLAGYLKGDPLRK